MISKSMPEDHFTPLVEILDLGLIDYRIAWAKQSFLHQELVDQKRNDPNGSIPNRLIICQHPPVYTMGKSGKEENIIWDDEQRRAEGVEFYRINRGGDITYHGPGQLVVYPIFDLDMFFRDVHRYVRSLEEVVIRTLGDFGLEGMRVSEYTGVWLEGKPKRKICAIGVHLSRWVSMHGLALNVNTKLAHFNGIVPCGIADDDKTVTSMENELSKPIDLEEVSQRVIHHFKDIFAFENYRGDDNNES